MKQFITILACLATIIPVKSQNLTITLESPSISSGDTILLEHLKDFPNTRVLSTSAFTAQQDGKAIISDNVNSFSCLNLKYANNDIFFFADAGQKLNIQFDQPKQLKYATPTGGFYDNPVVYEYYLTKNNYNGQINDAIEKANYFNFLGMSDSVNKYLDIVSSIQKTRDWQKDNAFNKRTDNPVSVYNFAYDWGNVDVYRNYYEKHWKKLDEDMRATGAGQFYKKVLDIRRSLQGKTKAPDFNLTDTKGNNICLENLKGQYVLLFNWGLCGYVMQSSDKIIAFYERYSKYMTMITFTDSSTRTSIQNNNSPADALTMQPFRNLLNMDWISVNTDEKSNSEIIDSYLMNFTPCVILISPKGKVVEYGEASKLKKASIRLFWYKLFHKPKK
ncbi:MAG: redoxin domain-containing protein [Bacteroidaceae bacterium]|nr:redoxin domain-containing protein [Bacteroidaceae bacterium]